MARYGREFFYNDIPTLAKNYGLNAREGICYFSTLKGDTPCEVIEVLVSMPVRAFVIFLLLRE
jgi:hypothetical protein